MKLLRGAARPTTFVVVGTLAMVVHWFVAVTLVERTGLAPMLANIVGWLASLAMSFAGHWRWTFGDRRAPPVHSALRFFGLWAAAFCVNAAAYAVLLRFTPIRYDVALALVLLMIAVATYLASRRWVFYRD